MYALTTVISSVSQSSPPASCSSPYPGRFLNSPYPRHCSPRHLRNITQGRRPPTGIYSHQYWISSRDHSTITLLNPSRLVPPAYHCSTSVPVSVLEPAPSFPFPFLSSVGGHPGPILPPPDTKNDKCDDGKIEVRPLLGCERSRKETIKSKKQGRPPPQQGRRHRTPRLSLQLRGDCQDLSRSPLSGARAPSSITTLSSVELSPAANPSGLSLQPPSMKVQDSDNRCTPRTPNDLSLSVLASTSVEDRGTRKAVQNHDLLAKNTTASTVSKTSTTDPLPEMDSMLINSAERGCGSTTCGFPLEKPVTEEPPSSAPTAPLTPRVSRPKPNPISTRALKRAGSLPLNSTHPSLDLEESGLRSVGSNTRLDRYPPSNPSSTTTKCEQEHQNYDIQSGNESQERVDDAVRNRHLDSSNGEYSADEGCRDSGIALEKWDVPQRLLVTTTDSAADAGTKAHSDATTEMQATTTIEQPFAEKRKEEAFPSFSQLLYFTPESLDEGEQPQRGSRRRQRCQSWMHPKISRETDSEDAADLWSRSDVEVETKGDLNPLNGCLDDKGAEIRGTTTTKRKTRQKRVSSMVFGADLQSTLDAIASGLPPLPPLQQTTKAAALAPPFSSFFCPPPSKQQDAMKNKDVDYSSASSRRSAHSSNCSSSSSSSSRSSASATLDLSRPLSTPLESEGIPFSNLLDLATAKAENITGLYFARQLNMAKSQPLAIYSQNNSSNSTLDHQKIQQQQEHQFSNRESLSTETETETEDLLTTAAPPAGALVRLNVDRVSPESSVIHNSESVSANASLRITGAQEALQSGLSCVRTVSNLPPLPVFQSAKASPGGAGCRRTRAVTSFGSTSEQRAANASLYGYSVSTNQEQTVGSDNVDKGPSLEASRPPLSTLSKGPSHRRSHSASHFFHLSSLKHHSPAQFNLALCYEHGQGGVEQDLAKAIYFYQQAADQGHTKASYNIGCICYNLGEIRKAIAWFEGAGKCKVRGLDQRPKQEWPPAGGEPTGSQRSESNRQAKVECPMPRQNLMFPHELEDFLGGGERDGVSGDHSATSGPFTVYLPAILCLALLCRQGIKDPRDESVVILKRDPEQATELLKRLVQKAPPSSSPAPITHNPSTGLTGRQKKNDSQDWNIERGQWTGGRQRQATSSASLPSTTQSNRDSTAASEFGQEQLHAASFLSSSCPSLNLCEPNSSSDSSRRVRNKRSSFVEDAVDAEADAWQECRRPKGPSGQLRPPQTTTSSSRPVSSRSIPPPGSADAHETWAVQLAQRLLKIWQADSPDCRWRGKRTSKKNGDESSRRKKTSSLPDPSPSSSSSSSQDRRILRYHLLYITNPTLSKNLYNLGVLYDLHLDDRAIAIQCYTFAFQNSTTPSPESSSSCPLLPLPTPVTDPKLITMRINCAWNLGVLYVKLGQWQSAREWLLCAQKDIQLFETGDDDQKKARKGGTKVGRRRDGGLLDKGMREQKVRNDMSCFRGDRSSTHRDNNLDWSHGESGCSPSMKHSRKHGVWLQLSSPRNSPDQSSSSAQLSSSSHHPPGTSCSKEETSEGSLASGATETTTDSKKIAWVLRWIDSKEDH